MAHAAGVRTEGRTAAAAIATVLSDAGAVLVLDNCEHLLDECAAFVQAVLAAAVDMRVLATSREPLGLPGERVYPVRSLDHHVEAGSGWEAVAACAAVRLFADRAADAHPGFVVGPSNSTLVHEVCSRLDGVSLAIELAAARSASVPLRDLRARLDDRFLLLDAVTRTADPKHRSLRAAVAWSHDQLPGPEQDLFARLSVFPAQV